MAAASYGGYNCEFIDNGLDKYTCNICKKVLKDPRLTGCCGQHFCDSCLKCWFTKHRKENCPHCRAEGKEFERMLDKKLKREINSFRIHCTNKKEGCQWIGELGSLKDHLKSVNGCEYAEVGCTKGCRTKMILRKDLSNHLKNDCPFRPYQCEHCGYQDTYLRITGLAYGPLGRIPLRKTHFTQCPEFPLKCPNGCCIEDIKRKDMEDHRSQCLEEVVPCPNGCESKAHHYFISWLKRKKLAKHLKDECEKRPYTCVHCGFEKDYKIITTKHYAVCEHFPLECPNKCGRNNIKRKDIEDHCSQCPEEVVKCSYRCTKQLEACTSIVHYTLKRKSLAKHLKDECENRPYTCVHCGFEKDYKTITTKHYAVCEHFPLECPNKCGRTDIKKKDVEDHRNQCPEEEVKCSNRCTKQQAEACTSMRGTVEIFTLKRKSLAKHLKDECKLRLYKCVHCGLQDHYKTIVSKHYDVCQLFPLECPNKCGRNDIKRKDVENHRTQCPEEEVKCCNRCTKKKHEAKLRRGVEIIYTLKRKNLAKHLKDECELRLYRCVHCGLKDSYKTIVSKHYDVCQNFPLTCPNNCGRNDIKRKHMEDHHSQWCPKEPVRCPFEEAGCKKKLVRHELLLHMPSNQQQHLLMVMGAYKEIKREKEELKRAYNEIQRETKEMKKDHCTYRQEIQQLKQANGDIREELQQAKHDYQTQIAELTDEVTHLRQRSLLPWRR